MSVKSTLLIFGSFVFLFSTEAVCAQQKSITEHKRKAKKESGQVASSTKPTSHWAGSNAQFGFVMNTGNTDSTNISAGLVVNYVNNAWTNNAQLNMQFNQSSGTTTKERYYATDQVQYSFSKKRKNYVYSNVNFTDDKFSPYDYQVIGSAGYGRDMIKTPTFTWSLQTGPGMRYDNVRYQSKDEHNFVVYTASNANWKVTKGMSLSEQAQYTIGKPYNYLQSVTALTNKIMGNLAMQVSYTLQYYSQIPLGSTNTKKLDTITNVALVYNF